MKICIIGNGLISLSLAKALVNKDICVDIFYTKKKIEYNQTRTIGISKSNIEYFNKNILNIEKLLWKIRNIKINTENFNDGEIFNFSSKATQLFSILQNQQLYKILSKELKKSKFFNYKKYVNFDKLKKNDYQLIVNCDFDHKLTRKYFSNTIEKNYNSFAHITIIEHKKIIPNNTAIQIFTNKGPIAFLPMSNTRTSIVYSLRSTSNKYNLDVNSLIKKFNPKYKIIKIDSISKFKLKSSNLRRYYKNNILAFGDLLHKIHPLAGQGFNMSVRDIRELVSLINNKINLGLDLDSSVCIDFENKMKNKNYLFSKGVDWVYEFFNLESRIKSKFLSKSLILISKNKSINGFLKKIADIGLQV